ncbi:hbxip, putative [Acanthamoeba castellanii str. Neff]|jgi:hepatitis B virus X-interacting protein|uniref:Late endosomal/lysosomal adaptor and MAPK and MTOR activator 5 n=1 Tax=Acanthamoeba castellanii (strain ATCC 30010 / Neff) TaxID=1257118 RepID=L8H639_ACACF|nr:hbxip, putative [Acanthamoeba castellanii str. Neff]ELR20687.1 hbxip, putative [Acanthamoeba castellanii str. Neff]
MASNGFLDGSFEKAMTNLLHESGVVGVSSTDQNGLCVSAKGSANASASGYIRSLANRARELAPSDSEKPTICIETESTNIFIRDEDNLTVAVYRIP